jgi:hypothetical protein
MLICSLGYAGMLSGVCWHALWGMLYVGWGMGLGAYTHGVGASLGVFRYAPMLVEVWGEEHMRIRWVAYTHKVGA